MYLMYLCYRLSDLIHELPDKILFSNQIITCRNIYCVFAIPILTSIVYYSIRPRRVFLCLFGTAPKTATPVLGATIGPREGGSFRYRGSRDGPKLSLRDPRVRATDCAGGLNAGKTRAPRYHSKGLGVVRSRARSSWKHRQRPVALYRRDQALQDSPGLRV